MCRVATGGSFRTRELYTNDEEMIFTYRRPLVMNGIEELALRPDLLDRSILIHVKPIVQEQRRDEQTFRAEFDQLRPQLFGGLLNVLSAGIRKINDVRLSQTPRMADFARWGVAVEESLGFKPGEFLAAYNANIEEAHFSALDASPIANAFQAFLADHGSFEGTALRLLQLLITFIEVHENGSQKLVRRHPRFPKSANQLSAELARIEPNLNKRGIRVERGRTNRGRFIRLEYVFAMPKPQAA
jgi:putative DNA primase/helicase